MTIEQINQMLIEQGKNPNDYHIIIFDKSYSITPKSEEEKEKELLKSRISDIETLLLMQEGVI